jgi:pimeloyl-ACP methyl ester carboxylesterase
MQKTRVCVYDRAGVGQSDKVPGPPITSVAVATDLRALLRNAGEQPPYVLAGQSFGGMNIRMFAYLYPDTVAGMVLVDSSHPDQYPRFAQVLPKRTSGESAVLRGLRDGPDDAGIDFEANANLVRAIGGLGDKPLIVLTRSPNWPGDSFVPREWGALVEPVWQQLQAELVKLSSKGKQVVAKKAGHNIQADEPELVVAAILDVVVQVKIGENK